MKNFSDYTTSQLQSISLCDSLSAERRLEIEQELSKRRHGQEECAARCAERNRRDYGYQAGL